MERIFLRQLLIILITLTTGQLLACGDAFQLRFFPIGTSGNKIIIVESSLNRYWGRDTVGASLDIRDRWRGIITLKSLDKKGVFTIIKIIDSVDFLDRDYIRELKTSFLKALETAKTITNFSKAENQVIEFCNFNTECKFVKLKTDTINHKLTIVSNDNKGVEIKYPEIVVNESETSGGISNQTFKINSIRKIRIGKNTLLIVDCASGEEQNSQEEIHPPKSRAMFITNRLYIP